MQPRHPVAINVAAAAAASPFNKVLVPSAPSSATTPSSVTTPASPSALRSALSSRQSVRAGIHVSTGSPHPPHSGSDPSASPFFAGLASPGSPAASSFAGATPPLRGQSRSGRLPTAASLASPGLSAPQHSLSGVSALSSPAHHHHFVASGPGAGPVAAAAAARSASVARRNSVCMVDIQSALQSAVGLMSPSGGTAAVAGGGVKFAADVKAGGGMGGAGEGVVRRHAEAGSVGSLAESQRGLHSGVGAGGGGAAAGRPAQGRRA